MAQARKFNPHIKSLEQSIAARFGWQTGGEWRDKLYEAVEKKAGRLGLDDLAYCRMAVGSAAELEAIAEIIANSETRFFREPDQFEALSAKIIPHIVRRRSKDKRLDLWSAACSTGEEAYSLAMLASEALPQGESWRVNLVATDLRGSAIIKATQGSYPLSSIQSIGPRLKESYFAKTESTGRESLYTAQEGVRAMITFRRANLYDAGFWKSFHHKFDLIICNNLLLHFHALAARLTVERIAASLREGGFLMVMKSETSYVEHASLRVEPGLPAGFFRKG
jgi:chemotaxis methyl-accepting protein methylase